MSLPDPHDLLTGRQLEVMAWLEEWGEATVSNANEVATRHVASHTVKALVDRGLAQRDGKTATLTDAGHAALAANRTHIRPADQGELTSHTERLDPTLEAIAERSFVVPPDIAARAAARANADIDKAIEELQLLVDAWENAVEPDGSIDVRRRYIDRPFALARLETMRATRATAHQQGEPDDHRTR